MAAMIWRVLAVAAVMAASAAAPAQPYPSKPVKLIVPFAPGGGNDIMARFLAHRLSGALGQPFLVDNRPGAGGTIGAEAAVRAAPDGYTLLFMPSSYTAFPSLYKLAYDPIADIAPIAQLAVYPLLLVVKSDLPARSIAELVTLARANPGKLNAGSPGTGTTIHLAMELFASMAGIRMNHVPYKGAAAALTDVTAGRIDVYLTSLAPAQGHLKSGRVRALAVTGASRIGALADVPTLAESGVPGYEVVLWYGLAGPKGLPRPIVDRLNSLVAQVLASADAAEQFKADGVSAATGTPEQFHAVLKRETELWRRVVAEAGVRLD